MPTNNGWNVLFGNNVGNEFGVPFGVELDNRFDVKSYDLLLVVVDGEGDKLTIVNGEHALLSSSSISIFL